MKDTLVGVVLGAVLIWLGDIMKSRISRSNNTRYLAIRLIPVLDQLFDFCSDVAHDDGTALGQPAGGDGSYQTQTPTPALTLPEQVDWKSIDQKLLQKIMLLSSDLHLASRAVAAEAEDPNSFPDNGEVIAVRRYQYAKIALSCDDILKELRTIIKMPEKKYSEWWNPRENCIKYIKQLEEIQNKREELHCID